MDLYIKQLVEAFDFNSVKKQNKNVNAVDVILQYIIIQKIDRRERLSKDEYDILMKFVGIYKVSDHDELQELIKYFIEQFGNKCNLNWIDVSNVINMDSMFQFSNFNGDISQWNVSNTITMFDMFHSSKFNGDISQWNVSNVTNMWNMFRDSKFNSDISQWNVSNVTNMLSMFQGSVFNSDISQWNVGKVTDKSYIFSGCPIKKEYKPKFK